MGPLKQKTIVVNADPETAIQAAQQAIIRCGWSVSAVNPSKILASSSLSLMSWGENIAVQVQVSGNLTYLNIQSKSVFAIVDWGKNQENINKFLGILRQLVSIA